MALALEGRFEPFSQGRGFITPARVEEIETIASRHGIHLAPLYNAQGPVADDPDAGRNGQEISAAATKQAKLANVIFNEAGSSSVPAGSALPA